jgi:hypothetical protein
VFPDGTPGLLVLAVITRQVDIDALEPGDIPDLPAELIMDSLPDRPKSNIRRMHRS